MSYLQVVSRYTKKYNAVVLCSWYSLGLKGQRITDSSQSGNKMSLWREPPWRAVIFLLRKIHAVIIQKKRDLLSPSLTITDSAQPEVRRQVSTLSCSVSTDSQATGVHKKQPSMFTHSTCLVLSHSRHGLKVEEGHRIVGWTTYYIYFLIYNSHKHVEFLHYNFKNRIRITWECHWLRV